MKQARYDPWSFVVLVVLILVASGAAVLLAAQLTVAPQAGQTVEVEASPQTYGINDELFYPWNSYDPEDMAQLVPWAQGPDQNWYRKNLMEIPEYLGFFGMETMLEQGRTGQEAGFWLDCPVSAADGQPAFLDVAYAYQGQQFGMGWVARSTGEVPTYAQKETAIAQVQWDVCAWLSGQESTPLEDNIMHLWDYLGNDASSSREEAAAAAMSPILEPLTSIPQEANSVDWTHFQAICHVAASQGLQIQLASTQRQVVLVLSPTAQVAGRSHLLAVYYDIGLEQYSGLVINATQDSQS